MNTRQIDLDRFRIRCRAAAGLRSCHSVPAVLLSAALLSTGPAARAQARPDAGQILRETEPAPAPLPRPGESKVAVPPQAPVPAAGEGTVQVQEFRFTGNQHIPARTLMKKIPSLRAALGQVLGLAEFNALAEDITRFYRSRGYLVAVAYVPAQEVSGGVVTFAVLEGYLDETSIQVKGRTRYATARLRRFLDRNLLGNEGPGAVLERRRVERALGILADLPGVEDTSAVLSPGGKVGTTSFELDLVPGPTWTGQLGADNFGSKYTDRGRATGNLRLDNPGGFGDRLGLAFITSGNRMSFGNLDYSLPLGFGGWRWGVQGTTSTYRLGDPFDATDSHGRSTVTGTHLDYPILRSNNRNLFVRWDYQYKWLEDDILESAFRKQAWSTSLTLSGNALDALWHGGYTTFSAAIERGYLRPEGEPLGGATAPRGKFVKVDYSLTRDQTLAYLGRSRLSLYGSVNGQWAHQNLDSSEKFSLGGPDGVRAYPAGEASGDMGDVATLEVRWSAPLRIGDLSFGVFRDMGWLKVNHDDWAGFSSPSPRRLAGSGLSVSLHRRHAYEVKVIWAIKDAGGEEATSEPDSRTRVWLQGSVDF